MDIRGVGAGGAGPELAGIGQAAPMAKSPETAVAGLVEAGADTVAGSLAGLSETQVASLMQIVQPPVAPQTAAQVEQLLRAAAGATAEGEIDLAVAKLSALLSLDPQRAEELASDPALAPIRREVAALVARLGSEARLGADTRLQAVAEWLRAPAAAERPIGDLSAATLLQVARQLNDAGGLANWVQSARVSQMILDTDADPGADAGQLLRAAISDVRRGDAPAALAKLARMAQALPSDLTQVHRALRAAVADVQGGDAPAALAKLAGLAEAIPSEPAQVRQTLQAAVADVKRGDAPAALAKLAGMAEALAAQPAGTRQLLSAAMADLERGDFGAALAKLAQMTQQAVPADPAQVHQLARGAAADVKRGDVAAAKAKLAALAESLPNDLPEARQLLRAAAADVERGDVPGALAKLARLAQTLPGDPAQAHQVPRAPVASGESAEVPAPPDPATVRQLLQAAAADVEQGDIPAALAKLAGLAVLDPARAETLPAEPALAPIRREVEELLAKLTETARQDAGKRLSQAAEHLQAAPRTIENLRPSTLLALAARLLDAGGHMNWSHSAEISRLLTGGETPRPPDPAQTAELFSAVISAAKDGQAKPVLDRLTALAALDPRRAAAAVSDPALAPVRAEAEALLARLASSARLNAETQLEAATLRWRGPESVWQPLPDLQPATLLLWANRMMEDGGYANYIQLTAFCQAIIDLHPGKTRAARQRAPREPLRSRFGRLWRRAPLLILLLAWLAVGIGVGVSSALFPERWTAAQVDLFFEIWALGFLALIGLQFYMRVRRRR